MSWSIYVELLEFCFCELILKQEIDSSSDGATPTSAPGDLQPVDVIALSLVEELKLHISDGSLSVNITDIMYMGPKANTQAPPTTTDKSVKKEKVESKYSFLF